MNLFNYIEKYKDISFDKKPYNEIDILIFSQLSYLLFDEEKFNKKKNKLSNIKEFISNDKKKEFILAQKDALKILTKIENTKRYKDLLVYDHSYIFDQDTQFGVITIELPDVVVVSYEGTDALMSGWKEDAIFAYKYPTNAQKLAKEYLSSIIRKTNKKIITTGHSKGGNLALTSVMQINIFDRFRVKEIYSFDGPGLKTKQFKSLAYKTVRKKLRNIIPNQSIVGVILNQENVDVIKSQYVGILQHAPWFWQINNDKLVRTEQSALSIEFDNILTNYLDRFNDEEREQIINNIFGVFEKAGVDSLNDLSDNLIKSIKDVLKETKNLDEDAKKIIMHGFKLLVGDVNTSIKEITESKVNDLKKEAQKRVKEAKEKFSK